MNHDSKGEIYYFDEYSTFELWGGLVIDLEEKRSPSEFARGITIGHSDKSNLTDNR